MPELVCVSDTVKAFLVDEARKSRAPKAEIDYLREIRNCDNGDAIRVKRTRTKRAPSRYNIFVGQCMRDGNNMKTCAVKWKTQKT